MLHAHYAYELALIYDDRYSIIGKVKMGLRSFSLQCRMGDGSEDRDDGKWVVCLDGEEREGPRLRINGKGLEKENSSKERRNLA